MHHLVVAGDFNASILAKLPDARYMVFRNFIPQNKSSISRDHPRIPTYTKRDGTECSSLDYILTDQNTESSGTTVVMIDTDTSDHYPVHTCAHITPETTLARAPQRPASATGTKIWAKVDLNTYKSLLEKKLSVANLPETIESQDDAQTVLSKVSNVMVSTKNQLIPRKKSARRIDRSKLQPKWTPAMAMATKLKKKAIYQWKKAGNPRDKEQPALIEHKKRKKKLRQIQRKQGTEDFS